MDYIVCITGALVEEIDNQNKVKKREDNIIILAFSCVK
jgi:hypothetical protein